MEINMNFLSDQDKKNISRAILQVEEKTLGEIVTVIAKASNRYIYIPTLYAALVAFCVPILLFLFPLNLSSYVIYGSQVGTFILTTLIFRYLPIKMILVPKAVKDRRASRYAMENFFRHGLHLTQNRTGVLIFVSYAEHYVRIIVDQGISTVITQSQLDEIVENFISKIKSQNVAQGFLETVESCGKILQANFPRLENKKNDEIKEHFIIDESEGEED